MARATTRRGSIRRRNASPSKRNRRPRASRRCSRSWNGVRANPRRARQEQGATASATKSWRRRSIRNATRPARSTSRRVRGSGERRHRGQRPAQGFRRSPPDRRSELAFPRAAASSASSARTVPARRRCSACCTARRSRTRASPHRRHRQRWRTSISRARSSPSDKTVWEVISNGQDITQRERLRDAASRAYVRALSTSGSAAAAAGRRARRAVSAIACTSARC